MASGFLFGGSVEGAPPFVIFKGREVLTFRFGVIPRCNESGKHTRTRFTTAPHVVRIGAFLLARQGHGRCNAPLRTVAGNKIQSGQTQIAYFFSTNSEG
jgi:hypothetical protein